MTSHVVIEDSKIYQVCTLGGPDRHSAQEGNVVYFRAMFLHPATEAYFAFLDRSWREVAMKNQQLTPKQIQVRSALLITYVSYTMPCRTPFMPNGWRFAKAWSIQRARKKVALSKRGRRQGRCRCNLGHRRRISLHT